LKDDLISQFLNWFRKFKKNFMLFVIALKHQIKYMRKKRMRNTKWHKVSDEHKKSIFRPISCLVSLLSCAKNDEKKLPNYFLQFILNISQAFTKVTQKITHRKRKQIKFFFFQFYFVVFCVWNITKEERRENQNIIMRC
jgi:hypothetical protein